MYLAFVSMTMGIDEGDESSGKERNGRRAFGKAKASSMLAFQ